MHQGHSSKVIGKVIEVIGLEKTITFADLDHLDHLRAAVGRRVNPPPLARRSCRIQIPKLSEFDIPISAPTRAIGIG
jgi:hypothetical protein